METITCFCEHTFQVNVPETIDIDSDPGAIDRVMEGTFLSFTCPKCGTVLKPEFPVRFKSISRKMDILYLPEMERDGFLSGRKSYSAGRIVIGFRELQEKLGILKSGLDDRVIELIKMYLLIKSGSNNDLRIYFKNSDGERLTFHIEGLEEGKTAVTNIPVSLYGKLEKEVADNTFNQDFSEVITPPYISINKIKAERN